MDEKKIRDKIYQEIFTDIKEDSKLIGTMPNTGERLFVNNGGYYIVDQFNRIEVINTEELKSIREYFESDGDNYTCEQPCNFGFITIRNGKNTEVFECGGYREKSCRFSILD